MKFHRIALAAASIGALSCAAQAQGLPGKFGQISQSGNGDTASIEQTTQAGATVSSFITQSGGSGNNASVVQFPSAPGNTSGNVSQFGTTGDAASVVQAGTSNGTTLDVTQSGGSGSSVTATQVNANGSRIRADQLGASTSTAVVQQTDVTAGAYVGTEQIGTSLHLTVIQGQSAAPGTANVTNSSARIYQNGQNDTGTTTQSNLSNSVSYISQGSLQQPGYYWGGAARQWVPVEPNLVPEFTADSNANITQSAGFGQRAYILQYGLGQNAFVNQSGSGNLGGILQTGSGNYASVTQSGFSGVATVSQQGTALNAFILQSGNANTATIRQR